MLDILDVVARGIGYLSLTILVAVLVAAIVMNLRPAPKKPTRAGPVEPVIAHWAKDASPHPLKHPAVHVDAHSADEAWAAISRRAS